MDRLTKAVLLHGNRRVVNDLLPAGPSMKNDRGGLIRETACGDRGVETQKHPGRREQERDCEGLNPMSAAGTKVPGQAVDGLRRR